MNKWHAVIVESIAPVRNVVGEARRWGQQCP